MKEKEIKLQLKDREYTNKLKSPLLNEETCLPTWSKFSRRRISSSSKEDSSMDSSSKDVSDDDSSNTLITSSFMERIVSAFSLHLMT
jgi:predicted ATP-grasp superfamily ATP-dependent carboligase